MWRQRLANLFSWPHIRQVYLWLLGVLFLITMSILVAYNTLALGSTLALEVGQVVSEDIRAPRSISYESDVLTRQARQSAEEGIRPIYDPPDPSVLRKQVQLARNILDFIDNVRHDSYANLTQKRDDLQAITALKLDEFTLNYMLDVSSDMWKDIDEQVMQVLERVMRNEIREDSVPVIIENLPNLVSLNTDEQSAKVVVALVRDLIAPNSFYNEERTATARQTAANNIPPEMRSFIQGQVVIRAGTIVNEADMEALTLLGLQQPPDRRTQIFLGAFLMVAMLSGIALAYFQRFDTLQAARVDVVLILAILALIFMAGSRVMSASDAFQLRLFPAAAFGLIVVSIAGSRPALLLTAFLGVLIGLTASSPLEPILSIGLGGLAGILTLRRTEFLNTYFMAGLAIALINVGIGLIFIMFHGPVDVSRTLAVIAAGLINGGLSAGIAIVGLYIVSNVLNLPTSVRLLELSQPSQPLLQRLLREAPGTYQHSLQVANLAEMATERVGGNTTLVHVAALYHDIGKMIAPLYFVENQMDGINPHDALRDPYRSAQIILSHVSEGEKLARKHRLPQAIVDFIVQHHGTTTVLYFYNKALEAATIDEQNTRVVNKQDFMYSGGRPRTREGGILMLADACESTVRARRPTNKQQLEQIVREIFEARLADAQLDECQLTMQDLTTIREAFISTLQGMFHPRVAYPQPLQTQEMAALNMAASSLVPYNKIQGADTAASPKELN